MAGLQKIVGSNTLKTGFMDIFNGDVDEIIDGATIEIDGLVKLNKHGGGFIPVDLRPYFYTKTQSENLLTTPLANESTFGKVKRATEEDALNGIDDIKYMSAANVQIKLEDYFSKAEVIGDISERLLIGNEFSETKVLGDFFVGNSKLYPYKIEQADGSFYSYLGVETDFQADGRISAVGGIEVGMGGVLITKEVNGDNIPYGQITAENYIDFVTPVVNFPNVINVNTIGATGSSIAVESPVYFNQAIYIQPSAHPNSPITNQQFDVALAAYDFGNIRIYSPVRAASNGSNVTLFGEYMLDSVNLVDGDKVLVKDQTDATQNYIYIVKNGAAWVKVTDLPNNTIKGIQVQVTEGGLVNKGGLFINTNATDVTVGVTEITFRQSYQNVLNPYAASLASNNQVFQGTNKFDNKLEVRTPLTGTEAANMDYVLTKVGELNTAVVNGYWPKKNNYGIGTTTNNALEFYANNVKEAQINVGGRMTGLKGLHINDDVFTPPFATSGSDLANYYGITVRDNVHIGALGGTSRELYSLDLVRGNTTGNRAGVRFGNYVSSGGVLSFNCGIEYSTGEKLSFGRYSSSAMDGTGVSFDSSKITTYDSSGNWAFGKNNASYRVDVNGDVNVSGMFRLNGSFGADHTFLKSNGTTQEFAPMTVGEIEDIETYYQSKISATENYLLKKTAESIDDSQLFDNGTSVVVGGTSAIDSSKFSVDGKIGATLLRIGDNDSGINIGSLAISSTGALGYGATSHSWNISGTEKLNLNGTRLALTGNFELNGLLKINGSFGEDHYFVKYNGTSVEWAALNTGELEDGLDIVKYATLDSERGIPFYSDVEKTLLEAQISVNAEAGIALGIYGNKFIDDDTSNVKQFGLQLKRADGKLYHYTLDGTQERILTTADQLGGGGNTWNGGTVSGTIVLTNTSGLNLQYSGYPFFSSITTRQETNQTDPYLSIKSQKGIELEATSFLNLKGGEVAINDLVFDTSNAASLVGQDAKFEITSLGFGRYKATLIAA